MGAFWSGKFYAQAQAHVDIDPDWDKALLLVDKTSQNAEHAIKVTRKQMSQISQELRQNTIDLLNASGSQISDVMGEAYCYVGKLIDQVNQRSIDVIKVNGSELKNVTEIVKRCSNDIVHSFNKEFRESLIELEKTQAHFIGNICSKAYNLVYSIYVLLMAACVVPKVIENYLQEEDYYTFDTIFRVCAVSLIIFSVPAIVTFFVFLSTTCRKAVMHAKSIVQNKTVPLTILIIGQTGAGKSSLINLLHHWSKQGPVMRFPRSVTKALIKTKYLTGEDYSESSPTDQSISGTTQPVEHNFSLKSSDTTYNLVLYDTPGLGDTRGLEQDDENIRSILNFVKDKNRDLNGIFLVLNGADPRLSPRLQFIIEQLKGLIPHDLSRSITVIFTNTQVRPNLNVSPCGIELQGDQMSSIDNLLFSQDLQNLNEEDLQLVAESYNRNIKRLISALSRHADIGATSIKDYTIMADSRECMRFNLNQLQKLQKCIEEKRIHIHKVLEDIASGNADLDKLNKELYRVQKVKKKVCSDTPHHNTICLVCDTVCHENCGLEDTKDVRGHPILARCSAFSGEQCNVCKCSSIRDHTHQKKKFVECSVDEQVLDSSVSNVKRKKMKHQDLSLLMKLECELEELRLRQQQCLISIQLSEHYGKFRLVCKWYNPILVITLATELLLEEEMNLKSLPLEKLRNYFGCVPTQEMVDTRLRAVEITRESYRNIEKDWRTTDKAAEEDQLTINKRTSDDLRNKIEEKLKEIAELTKVRPSRKARQKAEQIAMRAKTWIEGLFSFNYTSA